MTEISQRLRNACDSVRAKSYPLSDLIPLMQQAADALDAAALAQPVAAEPFAYLVERSAFRVSPHGQDAESNEWLEEAKPDEPGAFPVYRHPPPTPA